MMVRAYCHKPLYECSLLSRCTTIYRGSRFTCKPITLPFGSWVNVRSTADLGAKASPLSAVTGWALQSNQLHAVMKPHQHPFNNYRQCQTGLPLSKFKPSILAVMSAEIRPKARRTHARRSCELCKVRKTRCELPDIGLELLFRSFTSCESMSSMSSAGAALRGEGYGRKRPKNQTPSA